ncbi:MAG: hypothetical protein GY801_09675 [bacterium]|nr:hypothetical protein [bacterium]
MLGIIPWGIWVAIILPFLVGAVMIISQGVPEALLDGDGVLIEISVQAALEGTQWVGPYSRFEFKHPGPAYLLLLAPLYRLTGESALSFHITVMLLNILWIGGMLWIIRSSANRWIFFWFALLLTLYIHYLGPVLWSFWNPYVTMLPFLLAILSFAAVAAGNISSLPIAVSSASFAVQTHLGYSPAIAVTAICSLGLFIFFERILPANTQQSLPKTFRKSLIISIIIIMLLWGLPFFEQITQSPGNISKILTFFTEYEGDHSWQEVGQIFARIFLHFPLFFVKQDFSLLPQGEMSGKLHIALWGQLGLVILAGIIASRSRQRYVAVLSLFCGILAGMMMLSLKRIVGPVYDYLIAWMAVLGVLSSFVIVGAIFQAVERRLQMFSAGISRWIVLVLVVLMAGKTTAANVQHFYQRSQAALYNRLGNTHTKDFHQLVPHTLDFLKTQSGHTWVVKANDHDLWPTVAGLVLQLKKAGFSALVDDRYAFQYPPGYDISSIPDGMLILSTPATYHLLQQTIPSEIVAQTQNCIISWRPNVEKPLEGSFSFAFLPTFALNYQGFLRKEAMHNDLFRWASGSESKIAVFLEEGNDYQLTISGKPFTVPKKTQTVALLLNGTPLAEYPMLPDGPWQDFVFDLPGQHVKALNDIILRYNYSESPYNLNLSPDPRTLAVAFKSITFHKTVEVRQ